MVERKRLNVTLTRTLRVLLLTHKMRSFIVAFPIQSFKRIAYCLPCIRPHVTTRRTAGRIFMKFGIGKLHYNMLTYRPTEYNNGHFTRVAASISGGPR
jgi:hypothetical protein